ncbi:cytochrome P450 CYP71D313-like [Apium graveolens]|uniref:cytochrome P450 CYP71D313-like n=1 Tax=Apium graveolens TaxID=4045 RepID=UPI003D7A2E58
MDVQSFICVLSVLFIFVFLISEKTIKSSRKLPPGPRKLPIIGNILQLAGDVQHRVLTDLSKKYGPFMHLQLAEVQVLVVSSSAIAKEIMKTHDLAFANRAQLQLSKIMLEGCKDVAFNEYDDYWRQMRKICTVELLTASKVNSFQSNREDEVWKLVDSIKNSLDTPINLTHKFGSLANAITCRAAFGQRNKNQDELVHLLGTMTDLGNGFDIADLFPSYKFLHNLSGVRPKLLKIRDQMHESFYNIIKEHEQKRAKTKDDKGRVAGEEDLVDVLLRVQENGGLQFPITSKNIQGIISDMLTAGTDTTAVVLDWTMSELIRNPKVMEKAQTEVREAFKGKTKIREVDLQDLSYLKLVIKETLRLHPPAPLLLPRECREQCEVQGYTIPVGTKLMINAWAVHRDPAYWPNAESFEPERFMNNSIDYNGTNPNYIPFGGGRRSCPGIAFGIATIELSLASLLYHFNWQVPNALQPEDFDMNEVLGATVKRKTSLLLNATSWTPN